MQPLRTAVVGVGQFGQHHAGKYAKLPGSRLVAIADRDAARAAAIAAMHGVEPVSDYRELFGRVDAVSIATPPASHFAVARDFIEHGVHVLIEKPITESLEDSASLIRLAAERGRVLQVGHIERFSAVGQRLREFVDRPLYIQARRVGPYTPRGDAVSIVLDLMIHDLDLVLSLIRSPIETVQAAGAPVVTRADDMASCRLQFGNGAAAELVASRVSLRMERKIRIFHHNFCVSADYVKRRIAVFRLDPDAAGFIPGVKIEEHVYPPVDALEAEIGAFLDTVRKGGSPVVSGEDGQRALAAALLVDRELRGYRQRVGLDSPGR